MSSTTNDQRLCEADQQTLLDVAERSIQHGLEGSRVATFLPSVWETLQDPEEFFRHLRLKAGLDPDHWQPGTKVSTYTTQCFSRGPRHERVQTRDAG